MLGGQNENRYSLGQKGIYLSIAAYVGIGAAQLGWYWADPVIAVCIGLIILKTAWQLGYKAVHSLMDGFDAEKLAEIEQQIEQVEGIERVYIHVEPGTEWRAKA
jgi:divalent metal cation (Fe/Co/Zn/Cd) transporter